MTTKTTIKEKEVSTKEVLTKEVLTKEVSKKDVKFSKEEMEAIATIKQKYDAITVRLGQFSVEEMSIRHAKELLESEYKALRKEETDYATSLSKKYGAGQLNLDTGVFIPGE